MRITIPVDAPELDAIRAQIADVQERLAHMATQEQVDAIAASLTDFAARFTTGIAAVRQDIADIRAANPGIDLGPLEASVAAIATAATDLETLDAENPPPA